MKHYHFIYLVKQLVNNTKLITRDDLIVEKHELITEKM